MNENNHDTTEISPNSSSWRRFWSRFIVAPEPSTAHRLYDRLVRHARFPLYYDSLGVPDTPEGRFEILALHVGLLVRKLCSLDEQGRAIGQGLFDLMIADLDMNLREIGVGDLSVGKQVKRLAGQFYARLAVLDEAFDQGRIEALQPMLQTNVYGAASPTPDRLTHLVDIVAALMAAMDRQPAADLKAGQITLPSEEALSALGSRQPSADPGE